MSSQPVQAFTLDTMERLERSELISYIYALYLRMDNFDDHENRLRTRAIKFTLPIRENPVQKWEDSLLENSDLHEVMAHALHIQTRLDEYLVTFHDIYRAMDSLSSDRRHLEAAERRKYATKQRTEERRQKRLAMTEEERTAYRTKKREEWRARYQISIEGKATTVTTATIDGIEKTLKEWTQDPRCKIGLTAIYARINRGWRPEDAVLLDRMPVGSSLERDAG